MIPPYFLYFLLVSLLVPGTSSRNITSGCNCGYGGLCLAKEFPRVARCDLCDKASKGYYTDCSIITDHCTTSPCRNGGRCVNTFGHYICRCPKGFFGQNCTVTDPTLTRLGVSNELYVYHQVQPNEYGLSYFTIIYDVLDLESIGEQENFELMVNVSTVDGRYLYPTRGNEFVLENVKEKCLRECRDEPELYDQRVCDLLPDGDVWSYEVDVSDPFSDSWMDSVEFIFINETLMGVAVVGYLKIIVEFEDLNNRTRSVLFDQTYNFLQYTVGSKIPYNCPLKIHFSGCGDSFWAPASYPRGYSLRISATLRVPRNCRSLLLLETWWSVQRNIFQEEILVHDSDPWPIPGFENTNVVKFKPRFFRQGVHLLEYTYRFRGVPTHYGSPREFTLTGRCWIQTIVNPPRFYIEGGENKTASCVHPLHLTVGQDDPGVSMSSFTFYASCSNASDPECDNRSLIGHHLTKFATPCNTTYQFTITARHLNKKFSNITPVNARITFIQNDVDGLIACWFNCHPINHNLRVMAIVRITPYVSDPVNWTVRLNNEVIPHLSESVDIFRNSSATRLVRIDGAKFKNITEDFPPVVFTVQRHLLRVTSLTHVDNISPKLKYISFEQNGDDAWFEISEDPKFTFPPVRYTVTYVFSEIRVFYTEEIANRKNEYPMILQVDRRAPFVQLCYSDAFLIRECTGFHRVELLDSALLTFQEVRDLLVVDHDHLAFIKSFVILVAQKLRGKSGFRQRLPYNLRVELLRLIHQVVFFHTFDVVQIFTTISTFFYSEMGCEDLGFAKPFVKGYSRGPRTMSTILEVRYKTMQVAIVLCDKLYGSLKATTGINRNLYGDVPNSFFNAFTLAYIQTYDFNHRYRVHVKDQDEQNRLTGEKLYFRDFNDKLVWGLLWRIIRTISTEKVAYYGLHYVKKGKFCRLWSTLTSYPGMLKYFNRSQPATERLRGYTDYIFGPPSDDPDDLWVQLHDIQLPQELDDDSETMFNHVFCAVALARQLGCAKDSTTLCDTNSISASMLINIRGDFEGKILKDFTSEGYNVSLPFMVNGSLSTSEFFWEKKYVTKQPGVDEEVYWYKFRLEDTSSFWDMAIIFEHPISLKILAFSYRVPDSDEILASPEVTGFQKIDRGPFKNHYVLKVPVIQERRRIQTFYAAINLPKSLPPGRYKFWSVTSYPKCEVRHPIRRTISSCSARSDWFEKQMDNIVHCRCTHLGLVYAYKRFVSSQPLLVQTVDLGFGLRNILPGILFPTLLVACVLLFSTAAIFADHRRMNTGMISSIGHVYPTATYPLIIGVLTCLHPLAGTYSRIAVQIIGQLSATEVILLSSDVTQPKRPHIRSDSDVWFMTAVKEHPGTIRQIRIWHDFYCVSDWYCCCILIHDVHESRWYIAEVHHWFRMYPSLEDSRMVEFPVEYWNHIIEEKRALQTQTFEQYYFRELCNTHAPLCLFLLHRRNVSAFEQKSNKYLAKILSTSFLSWVHLTFVVTAFPDKFFYRYSPEERITDSHLNPFVHLNSFTILSIAAIALLTRVFVLPLHYFYRSIIMSKTFRRQTSSARSVSPKRSMSSRRSGSTRRSGSHRRSMSQRRSESAKRSSKRSFSTRRSARASHGLVHPASTPDVNLRLDESNHDQTIRRQDFRHSQTDFSEAPYTAKKDRPSKGYELRASSRSRSPRRSVKSSSPSPATSRALRKQQQQSDIPEQKTATSEGQEKVPIDRHVSIMRLPDEHDEGARQSSLPEYHRFPLAKASSSTAELSLTESAMRYTVDEEGHSCWWIWFGPTHFRSVNADQRILKQRSFRNMMNARFYLGLLSAGLLTFFIYIAVASDFWETNTGAIFFYILMALFLDASVLEPVIIFFKSYIAYAFCELTNSPVVNIWNMQKRKVPHLEPDTDWKKYLEAALSQSLPPLLSSELEIKRRTRLQAMIGLLSAVYLIMMAFGGNLYYTVSSRHIQSMQRFKAMTVEVESSSFSLSAFDRDRITISEVIDYKTAVTYVTTSYVKVGTLRPNGKNISKDGRYWELSGYALPFQSTVMITLYYSRSALNSTSMPNVFSGVPSLNIFKLTDFYEQSTQETKTITVNTEPVKYQVLNPWVKLIGVSGTAFPLAGHIKKFKLWSVPGSSFIGWPGYYVQLRLAMAVVYTSELFNIFAQDLEPSAILLVRNSYAPNLQIVGTLDVIIDFHPSGVCAADLEFEVTDLGETDGIRVVKQINCLLSIILFVVNVYILCKVGFKKYFATPLLAMICLFWMISFVCSFSAAYISSWKHGLMDRVSDSQTSYVELHTVHYIYNQFDDTITGLTFVLLAVITSLMLGYVFGLEKLLTNFIRCLHSCLPMMIFILAWMELFLIRSGNYFPLLYVYLKENIPLAGSEFKFSLPRILFVAFVVGTVILNQLFKAFVISRFGPKSMETDKVNLTELGLVKEFRTARWRTQQIGGRESISPLSNRLSDQSLSPITSSKSNASKLHYVISRKGIFAGIFN